MIIMVQGPPASGKTTLATRMSQRFGLPHISRDKLQEWLFAATGSHDAEIRRLCAHAGYDLMFDLAGELSKGTGSFIVEGCMNPEGGPRRWRDALSGSRHRIVEVFLTAPVDVLVRRYLGRADDGSRHAAHGDETSRGDELARHLREVTYRPMGLGGDLIEVDGGVDLEVATHGVLEQIGELLARYAT